MTERAATVEAELGDGSGNLTDKPTIIIEQNGRN